MRLTDTVLRALRPRSARYEVCDSASRGLIVCVEPSGTRTFVYRYGADRRKLKLGAYPGLTLERARADWRAARQMLVEGKDPRSEFLARRSEEAGAPTVADLVREWDEQYNAKERRRPEQPRAMFAKNLPKWYSRLRAHDKHMRRHTVVMLDRVRDRSPSVANDLLALLKQVFAFAVERGLLDATPLAGLKKPGGPEVPRDRTLTDEELDKVWNALPKCEMSERVRLALKLLILTAQRRGETSRMRWADINFTTNVWTIPAEDAKTGTAHAVPLSPWALEILRQLRELSDREGRESEYVFPSWQSKLKAAEPMTERAFTRAIAENRLKGKPLAAVAHFVPHDFRRTARTGMAKLGIPDTVAERVLNHKLQGMMAVYNRHSYLDEKRAALTAWAEYVMHTVTPH